MGGLFLLFLAALILFGAGFAVKALWYVAVVVFLFWVIATFSSRSRTGP